MRQSHGHAIRGGFGHAKIDGGPSNPLPVTAYGYWEDGRFHAEEIAITIGGKTFDLWENLSEACRRHVEDQITEDADWK